MTAIAWLVFQTHPVVPVYGEAPGCAGPQTLACFWLSLNQFAACMLWCHGSCHGNDGPLARSGNATTCDALWMSVSEVYAHR